MTVLRTAHVVSETFLRLCQNSSTVKHLFLLVNPFFQCWEEMRRILNVAEKPDAAKKIAAILSNGKASRRKGFSQYNAIFEFDFNGFEGGSTVKMVVTSVTGHLMETDFDQKYRNWNSCDPVVLFDMTTPINQFVRKDCENIEKTLKQEAKQAQKLVLWLDCDREGENICFEVIEVCRQANNRLSIEANSILRARFSEFTNRYGNVHRMLVFIDSPVLLKFHLPLRTNTCQAECE